MRRMKVLAAAAVLLASVAVAQDKGGKKKGGGIQLPPMIHISIEGFADGGRIRIGTRARGAQ